MELFTKGKNYSFSFIEEACQSEGQEVVELGEYIIGQNFLTFEIELIVYSFILTGQNINGGIYTCIFND